MSMKKQLTFRHENQNCQPHLWSSLVVVHIYICVCVRVHRVNLNLRQNKVSLVTLFKLISFMALQVLTVQQVNTMKGLISSDVTLSLHMGKCIKLCVDIDCR